MTLNLSWPKYHPRSTFEVSNALKYTVIEMRQVKSRNIFVDITKITRWL